MLVEVAGVGGAECDDACGLGGQVVVGDQVEVDAVLGVRRRFGDLDLQAANGLRMATETDSTVQAGWRWRRDARRVTRSQA